ncbi:MAG: hypothetical protein K0T00_2492 [Gaiellaceae bacterium]|nr:hypothetical protein [Gaiellaceae bacterium]
MRALVALLLLLALAGCGGDSEEAAAPETVTVTVTQTETVEPEPAETQPEEPAADCSTAGVRLTLPEQDLPAEVAQVRRRVFDAAVACDYETLEQIALEEGEGFTFSYGAGPEDSAAAHWRELEESGAEAPMKTLATLLTLPHTRNESGSYAWPSAYSESPTDADWQALADAGVYPQEQLDQMREGGVGYLGYRTAITADGDWQFFVAGD